MAELLPQKEGGATTQGAQGVQGGTTTAGPDGWQMPEKFTGKTAEDVARSYSELEREHGKMADQYSKMVGTVNQWREVWNQWDPVLSKFEYAPSAVAELLSHAEQLRAQGDRQGAAEATREAQQIAKGWGDIVDPREQGAWLDQRFGQMQEQLGAAIQNAMTQFSQAMGKYVNNYGNVATRAMSMKIANPELDINRLIEEAANISSGKYDALEWAARILQSPKDTEAMVKKAIADERTKWEEERNKDFTAFAGGSGGRVPYRTPVYSNGPSGSGGGAARVAPNLQQARASFVQRFQSIKPPE